MLKAFNFSTQQLKRAPATSLCQEYKNENQLPLKLCFGEIFLYNLLIFKVNFKTSLDNFSTKDVLLKNKYQFPAVLLALHTFRLLT